MFLLLFFLSTILANIEVPLEEIIASQSSSASFSPSLRVASPGCSTETTSEISTDSNFSQDSSLSVRPDPSINSGVNAALSSLSVRPEPVEGNDGSFAHFEPSFAEASEARRAFTTEQGRSISANGENTTNSTPTAQAVSKVASITITNAIDQSMLPYKHWTGTYTPEVFTVQINGTEVAQGAQYTLTQTKDPVEVSFDYSFMNGTRKGSKKVSYAINENSTDATITFSWKDTDKLILSNATPIKEIKA